MVELVLPAQYEALSRLNGFIDELVPDEYAPIRLRLQLAVHELCINIIEHAYAGQTGVITLVGDWRDPDLTITVTDAAERHYDPAREVRAPAPVLLPERGWGLAIVKEAMDEIRYQRRPTGNEWYLRKRMSPQGAAMEPTTQHPVLLVVDDEVITHRLISYTLKPLSIEVVGAENGASAYALLEERHFDLIFMDINLPGTDGFSLIKRLRELPKFTDVRLIMITGRDHPDDEERARELGASRFLYKPFSTTELRALVTELLGIG